MFSRQTEGWDKWKWNCWFQVKNATISKVYFQNCLWQTYQTLLFKRNKFAYSDKNLNGPFYKIKPNPTSRVNIKLNKTSWNNSLHCFLNEFWNNFCFSDHTSENQNALLSSQLESWTLWRHQLLKKAANLSWWLVMELFTFESNCSGLELSARKVPYWYSQSLKLEFCIGLIRFGWLFCQLNS